MAAIFNLELAVSGYWVGCPFRLWLVVLGGFGVGKGLWCSSLHRGVVRLGCGRFAEGAPPCCHLHLHLPLRHTVPPGGG